MKLLRVLLVAALALPFPVLSQENAGPDKSKVKEGHSLHGEVFNEGPRQKAVLIEGTGHVHFPATSNHPDVQKFIDQGVGQVHGFWYFEAERSFRQAAMLDPDCAIAYWGMAMAHSGNSTNSKRAKGFIAEAVKRKNFATDREGMYIDALNEFLNSKKNSENSARDITNAHKDIADKYPEDLEALAFYGLQVYKNRGTLKLTYEQVDEVLEKVFQREPMHPAHHYRIHHWDYKDAAKALKSSALCGQGSPGIAHMWHMPGHIYSRLKRYDDAAWQQEASTRVDHAHMMRARLMPDQIFNFAHNSEWLIRDLMFIGRVHDAKELARNMIELPRHPKFNTLGTRGSAGYGRDRLFDVLYRFELWQELIDACSTTYLEPTDAEKEQLKRLRHLGAALFENNDHEEGERVLKELDERVDKAKKAKAKPADLTAIEQIIASVKGHRAFADGDYKEAFTQFKKANEDQLVQARVQALAEDTDNAVKAAQAYVKTRENQVQPLAGLVEVLWLAGRKDEAGKEFKKLRDMSSSIQLESPVFARLAPIARDLGMPDDWRVKKGWAADVGVRPELDKLGPFRWQPSPAPEWLLRDADNKIHSRTDYAGKPVIMMFYLGYGCLHCAEQIQAFGGAAAKFRAAGIDLIAVSSDDMEGLRFSQKNYKDGPVPFPLVSDGELEAFKAFRAYDDFEGLPLHGTFLVDGQGLVRWQDISHEPFMDTNFLLKEAQRLLSQELKVR